MFIIYNNYDIYKCVTSENVADMWVGQNDFEPGTTELQFDWKVEAQRQSAASVQT